MDSILFMKVAVCLSGQPRRALDTYPAIYEHIIKPNNADVFIHMNYDKKQPYMEKTHMDKGSCVLSETIAEDIITLYNPVRYLVESPKPFDKPTIQIADKRLQNTKKMNSHKGWTDEECRAHAVKQITSMYYSIFKCNELKETYANENGVVYDFVIRVRFDFLPRTPIYCSRIDPNFIYYVAMGQPDELISDWLNMGSNAIMNVYASLYLNMEYLNSFKFYPRSARQVNSLEPSDVCGGLSEYMLRDLMYLYRIPKQAMNYAGELMV